MSDTQEAELEQRLTALEQGGARRPAAGKQRSPLLALLMVLLIGAAQTQQLREVVASGVIDDALAFCVENKLNMIVSGGTSTGKTVAARKILSHVPPKNGSSPLKKLQSCCQTSQMR